MGDEGLKKQVLSSVFWRFGERICAQLVTFIVSVILARILEPSHYGVVSLLTIFITIANVFVTDGFGKALIQKKDVDNCDYSTVFFFNILFSWLVYFIIFLSAKFVADFYHNDILTPVLRVLALRIPLAAINSVQQAYVSRHMMFKKFFLATLIGTLISAVVGIAMALYGFGVWALVAQYLTNSFIDTLMLWFTIKWRPQKLFHLTRLFHLLSYGWKILLTSLINTAYENLRSLVIGKFYSNEDLAYYTKGTSYPVLIINNVNTVISSVLFPALSKLQDDKKRLKQAMRRSITISTFLIFPLMMGLAAISTNLVKVMLTDKWLFCVPYLKIACIYLSLYPINIANLQAIMAVGRSDIYLRLNFIKKAIGLVLLFISIPFGVTVIVSSEIIVALLAVITNVRTNKKIMKYSFRELIEDIGKNLIMSFIMFAVITVFDKFMSIYIESLIICIIMEIILGGLIYISLAKLFQSEELHYIMSAVRKQKKT